MRSANSHPIHSMLTKANFNFLPRSLSPTQTALLTLWVLLMLSFPIVDWTLGWYNGPMSG